MARKLGVAVLVMLASLTLAGVASAREVVLRDAEGRTIRFDVRADADVQWYADLLRKAAHGDEIERVTVRIVDWDEIATRCASYAAGCYARQSGNRGVMVVPAGRTSDIAHTVVHEYGHHVDASRRHGGLDEPNGTPLWWKARGMAFLVGAQSVRDRYQVGWERSISEVFAEDYAYTNLKGRFKISWLERPSTTVQQAILADLGLAKPPVITTTRPALKPVVIERQGTLDPNDRLAVDLRAAGAEPPRPAHRDARRRRSRGRLVRHHVPCPRVGGSGADVARRPEHRPGSVRGVDRQHELGVAPLPLHRSAGTARRNVRRTLTKSASRARPAETLNSSAIRHVSRTASAASSAAAPAAGASSVNSSSRSAFATAASAPLATTTRSRYQPPRSSSAASSSARSAPNPARRMR